MVEPMFTTGALDAPNVIHGFFGRQGGVSMGVYESLNCGPGSDDAQDAVIENQRRVLRALGMPVGALRTVYQVHSAICVVADGSRPQADAMVTDQPGIALGILTADCAPVLFAGRKRDGSPVIGAAHAGWRGALGGVLENTVAAIEGLGAPRDSINAAIGPCIAQASYEVQPDFLAPFLNDDPQNADFFVERGNSWSFDLPAFVLRRLQNAGVRAASCGIDTYSSPDHFSYRRMTHRGEPDCGRQISVIGLPAAR